MIRQPDPLLDTYFLKIEIRISNRYLNFLPIAALFIVVKIWKQPKGPLMNERIKKIWCLHVIGYYSTLKIKEVLPFVMMWIKPEDIILNEINQMQNNNNNNKYYMIPLI